MDEDTSFQSTVGKKSPSVVSLCGSDKLEGNAQLEAGMSSGESLQGSDEGLKLSNGDDVKLNGSSESFVEVHHVEAEATVDKHLETPVDDSHLETVHADTPLQSSAVDSHLESPVVDSRLETAVADSHLEEQSTLSNHAAPAPELSSSSEESQEELAALKEPPELFDVSSVPEVALQAHDESQAADVTGKVPVVSEDQDGHDESPAPSHEAPEASHDGTPSHQELELEVEETTDDQVEEVIAEPVVVQTLQTESGLSQEVQPAAAASEDRTPALEASKDTTPAHVASEDTSIAPEASEEPTLTSKAAEDTSPTTEASHDTAPSLESSKDTSPTPHIATTSSEPTTEVPPTSETPLKLKSTEPEVIKTEEGSISKSPSGQNIQIVITDENSQPSPPVVQDKVEEAVDTPQVPPRLSRNSSRESIAFRRDVVTGSPTAPPRTRSSFMVSNSSKSTLTRMSTGALPRGTKPPIYTPEKKKRGMFSWLGGDSSKKKNKEVLETVSEGLRKIYKQKLYPLEEHYKFHDFHSPALDDPDFDAKPMILLVGQYSTGKTTFIRHLLEKDFPGIRIGPEPTTDRFIAVMHGDEEGVIPGNALVVDAKKQFRALSGFGNAFLNRFQCSTLPNQVLESVTIVDTPGILSGEKQRIDRGYDFTGVLEWFAERVDRIILLFDAHKLDISDEFKRCIEALAGNEDKIRIVLNKSDMVDHQQLMRVYGALMWSLGKVFRTPEVSRVYLGSFWDHPLQYDINRRLFQDEQHDLFQDLQALPRNAALRKLNDLIKRARLAKVHAYIIAELRKQMPSMIGKDKKKKELIQNLDKIFEQLQREHNISPGDFPDVHKMRERLQNQDFTKFNPLKPKLLEVVDGMLATDIARLMAQIPKEEQQAVISNGSPAEQPTVRGGAFSQAQEAETPFGFGRGEGFDKGANENEWVVNRERKDADSTFDSLLPVNGFLTGRVAKDHMVKSKLPNAVLGKIWKLADVDKDGQLDADEFALANYLINLKLEGHELPAELPAHLVPPSKRGQPETVYPALDDE